MHPILVDLNGFAIHTYGAMGALGFLFTAFTALWRGRKLGIAAERMADLIFWSALIAPLIYLALFALCSRDIRILNLAQVVGRRTPRTPNRLFWRTNSYGP